MRRWTLLAVLACTPSRPNDGQGAVRAEAAVVRASAGAPHGAAFLQLVNQGAAAALVAAEADFCRTVELHTHVLEGGVARMRPVPRIEVPERGTVSLAPGGLHVMFIDLERPLVAGSTVSFTLVFDDGRRLPVTAQVVGPKERGPPPDGR